MTIRVQHGMAAVELEGWEFRSATDRRSSAGYPTDDLIEATRRALAAADDGPLACWEKQLLAEDGEFPCARADDLAALLHGATTVPDGALPQWHDGPCEREADGEAAS